MRNKLRLFLNGGNPRTPGFMDISFLKLSMVEAMEMIQRAEDMLYYIGC